MSARMEKVREAIVGVQVFIDASENERDYHAAEDFLVAALAEVEEWEARFAELEVGIEKALLLLTRIDHDEGSRVGRAIEALEKTCR